MKIRNGFVSNSSSSNFIVPFSKIPQNVAEMKEMLFGDAEYFVGHSTTRVAQTVFEDFMSQIPATEKEILNEIELGYFAGMPDYFKIVKADYKEKELYEKQYKEYERLTKEAAKKLWDSFLESHKGKYFYIFSYSDNDGQYYSDLEHEGLFDNLDCITISHH